MAEEELDLVKFATRQVAQTGTGASQVVRSELLDAAAGCRRTDDVPQHLW
jgi:hypothetical protein